MGKEIICPPLHFDTFDIQLSTSTVATTLSPLHIFAMFSTVRTRTALALRGMRRRANDDHNASILTDSRRFALDCPPAIPRRTGRQRSMDILLHEEARRDRTEPRSRAQQHPRRTRSARTDEDSDRQRPPRSGAT